MLQLDPVSLRGQLALCTYYVYKNLMSSRLLLGKHREDEKIGKPSHGDDSLQPEDI